MDIIPPDASGEVLILDAALLASYILSGSGRVALSLGGWLLFILVFPSSPEQAKAAFGEATSLHLHLHTWKGRGMDDQHPTGVCLIPTTTLRAICIKYTLSLQGFNTKLLFSPLRPSSFRFAP